MILPHEKELEYQYKGIQYAFYLLCIILLACCFALDIAGGNIVIERNNVFCQMTYTGALSCDGNIQPVAHGYLSQLYKLNIFCISFSVLAMIIGAFKFEPHKQFSVSISSIQMGVDVITGILIFMLIHDQYSCLEQYGFGPNFTINYGAPVLELIAFMCIIINISFDMTFIRGQNILIMWHLQNDPVSLNNSKVPKETRLEQKEIQLEQQLLQ